MSMKEIVQDALSKAAPYTTQRAQEMHELDRVYQAFLLEPNEWNERNLNACASRLRAVNDKLNEAINVYLNALEETVK